MSVMIWLARLLAVFRKPKLEEELNEDIRSHLEMATEENLRRGMSPREALEAARRGFGGVEQMKEAFRDQRGLPFLESVFHELRYACRVILRTPSFSLVVVITLALGVGANTAVFSVVNAVILRPLPYVEPNRLVSVWEVQTERGNRTTVSPANLVDYRAQNRVFTDVAGYALVGRNLTQADTPERLWAQKATANLFSIIGVQPAQGRGFRPEEDRPGGDRVVIISHELWQHRFAADPDILGRTLRLDEAPNEIIGVMPPGFQAPSQFGHKEPISLYLPAAYTDEVLAQRGDHEIQALARLKPGVTLSQAQADLDHISSALAKTYPDSNRSIRAAVAPLAGDITRNVETSLLVLLGAVAMVWLIACINVANLLLARAISRKREIAVRIGLGASRTRVVAGHVAFAVLLSSLGGAIGLLVAVFLKETLIRLAPTGIPRLDLVTLDWQVLGVTAVLSVLVGVVLGLIPILQVSRLRPGEALRSTERNLSSTAALRWRGALVAAEIALSLVLLTGAGLLLKSFVMLNAVDLGFQSERVLAMNINLPQTRYPTAKDGNAFFERLTSHVAALPGVQTAAYANRLPMRGGWGGNLFIEHPTTGRVEAEVDFQAVSPGYFDALGISLQRGRGIERTDRPETPPVAVVTQTFVERFLPGLEAVGRRFHRSNGPWITIVGVVGDIRRGGKHASLNPQVFLPAAQTQLYPVRLADFAVRTSGEPKSLLAAIQNEVWAIDKDQPITNVKTLDEVLSESVSTRRFQTILLLTFSGMALILSLIGVYGVVSYGVQQRTAEIGLRVALGAGPSDVLRMVMRQSGKLILLGFAAGIGGAYFLSRYIESLLFGIEPTDPQVFAVVALLLCTAALGACIVPARRAARIDPLISLRYE